MSMNKRVKIVGDHPHKGSSGTVLDEKSMVMNMWEVKLDKGGGCFVDPQNLRPLLKDEDPYA